MISVQNPLAYKLIRVGFIICVSSSGKVCAKSSNCVLPQFRKVPEGFRKLIRKLISSFRILPQFRKVPEGFRKLFRKLILTIGFPAIRKVPEGFRKPFRKGSRRLFVSTWHFK